MYLFKEFFVKKALLISMVASAYLSTTLLAQDEDNHPVINEVITHQSKSGFFIGGGIGLGGSNKGKSNLMPISPDSIPNLDALGTHYKATFFTLDLNLLGGYQYYFDKNQKHAIRTNLVFGFSSKNDIANGSLDNFVHKTDTIYTNFLGFNFSINADYLYDFWEKGEQTIGASLGLGYKYNAGFISSLTSPDKEFNEDIISFSKAAKGGRITYHSITPRIGVHYYLGRHQFEFLTSLEPVLYSKDTYQATGTMGTGYLLYQHKFFYNFNLNYSYRF